MLKSRSTFPPGGWRFTEPKTGWQSPPGLDFRQLVSAIITHRRQNPRFGLPTDRETVSNELDDFTCALLRNDPNWCAPKVMSPFSLPLPALRPLGGAQGNVAGVANFIHNTSAGIGLWIDWFGNGKPVSQELAEQRASICVECPLNEKANLAQRFSAAAVKEIMSIFQVLNDLNLETSKDSRLNVCKACDCPLKAKVWAPLQIIKKHLTANATASLHSSCWILNEEKTTP